MLLQRLTSPNLIGTHKSFSSKEEIIQYMIDQLDQQGKLHSKEAFYQAVMQRESLSPTGFEGGLAIPHGKSTAVKEAAFVVLTLDKPLDSWESIDPSNQVEIIFYWPYPKMNQGQPIFLCWQSW